MEKFKGTEGEWEIMRFDNIQHIEFHIISGSKQICRKNFMLSEFDENRANAKAISAVPELLEALENLYYKTCSLKDLIDDNRLATESQTEIINKTLQQAWDALKKAGL